MPVGECEMSFRLRIDGIEDLGGETRIRGRLLDGTFSGAESIRLQDASGRQWTAPIIGVEMSNTRGWPVTADHDALLDLYILTPASPFAINIDAPVESLGGVIPRLDGIDLTRELSNPLFWANFATLYMHSEEMEDPADDFFPGLAGNDVGNYYKDFLCPLIEGETWPIFPLEIDGNRYAEIEWAGGAEDQYRLWIGSRTSNRRALLGYFSAHHSLPGLRHAELVWLLDRLEQADIHPASGLLLVPICDLPEPNASLVERVASLCTRIPGAKIELAGIMAANMVAHLVIPEATWERRPSFGWCSNYELSQRNPQGFMSVLSEAEFKFIDQFFAEVE
jgi:hypothetical protein